MTRASLLRPHITAPYNIYIYAYKLSITEFTLIKARRIHWNRGQSKLSGDVPVTLQGKNVTLKVLSFFYFHSFEIYIHIHISSIRRSP